MQIRHRVGLMAVLGVALAIAAPASAQQQPAPAPKPAAPQPAAPQQAAPAVTPIYTPWNKLCAPEQQGAKPTCLTLMEARAPNGRFLGGAGLVEQEGVEQKTLRITLPLAMLNPKGVQLTLDQEQPIAAPYLTCLPAGCLADFEAKPELVEKLKKGQALLVKAINLDGSLLSVTLPLTGFAKANAGPPTDPKVIEEQQKKLRESIKAAAPAAANPPAAPANPAPPPSGN